ncbi:TPA: hypothetical protein N5H07_000961 [Salmonella enterica subsp. enterica serovar Paratyphi B]|nr:hypothetical protein [Salmonella enterica subsp. enterica serovar Paratyphi B]
MNTEITTKNAQLIRSGYHTRGFVSAHTLLSIPNNKASKNAVVKYMGARIGRIDNLYYSDLHNGRVELHCDITFTGSLIMLAEMVKNKALYPVCVINTAAGPNQPWLSEVFFATEEDREFDEQEPINLKGLLNLVNDIAKSEAPKSAVLFNKKYDNTNSGLIGFVKCNMQKPQAVRLVSSFIPAINTYGKDEKSIDLIRRIITVVGVSENCRQDEIEAAYKMSLEELIDRLVRDWHAAFQPSS